MIVEAVRSGYFQARFDHKNNTVHFGGQEVESDRIRGHIAAMAKRLTRALAVINPAPAGGWLCACVCVLGVRQLHVGGPKFDEKVCVAVIHLHRSCPPAAAVDKEARRSKLVALALATAAQENKRMLQRKVRSRTVCIIHMQRELACSHKAPHSQMVSAPAP